MAIRPGDLYLLYWGGEAVPAQVNSDFNPETENRITSNKQTGNFQTSKPTRHSGSISVTAYFDDAATLSYADLFTDWKNKVIKELKLSTEDVGDFELVGNAYITSPGLSAPDQENVEVNLEFTFDGEFSWSEITA